MFATDTLVNQDVMLAYYEAKSVYKYEICDAYTTPWALARVATWLAGNFYLKKTKQNKEQHHNHILLHKKLRLHVVNVHSVWNWSFLVYLL